MIEPDPVVRQPPAEPNAPTPGSGPISDPLPTGTLDDNVEGQPINGPDDGFGQLWRKRYRIQLAGLELTPAELIDQWRSRFGTFWPEGNLFYTPAEGLEEGEVALADLQMPGGARLGTGVVVTDVQPTSFTFMTPRGHTFAGSITFSAEAHPGGVVAQVESIIRAGDPLYEIGLPLGGHAREDEFWKQTLRNLAAHFGVRAEPEMSMTLLDKRRRWRNAGNIRDNAFVHTAADTLGRLLRRLYRRIAGKGGSS